MAADKILINGRFYTENPDIPWAQAVAIEGKDFVYVGDNAGAEAFAGDGTEVVDMAGKTIIPGLLDGHTHPATVSKTYWFVRGPLLTEGVLMGGISALIAFAISNFVYGKICAAFSDQALMLFNMQLVEPMFLMTSLIWIFMSLGISIGAFGSLISMRRFLKV